MLPIPAWKSMLQVHRPKIPVMNLLLFLFRLFLIFPSGTLYLVAASLDNSIDIGIAYMGPAGMGRFGAESTLSIYF